VTRVKWLIFGNADESGAMREATVSLPGRRIGAPFIMMREAFFARRAPREAANPRLD